MEPSKIVKEQKSIFVPCDCHSHGLHITEICMDDDDGWYEVSIIPWFFADHGWANVNIWQRIKCAFEVLRKGRYAIHHDFLIESPEYARQIADYMNTFADKCAKGQWGRTTDFEDKNE